MTAVCIIPARGGSRRIVGKNIKPFHGRPIIEYSIEAALKSEIFREVYVSTDDPKIVGVAAAAGARIMMRDDDMARDEVGTQDVAKYVLDQIRFYSHKRYHLCFVVYPCAPMISVDAMRRARDLLMDDDLYPFVDYVVPVGKWLRDPGQWYAGRTFAFAAGLPFVHEKVNTRLIKIDEDTDCDINTVEDWMLAEEMYRGWLKRGGNHEEVQV